MKSGAIDFATIANAIDLPALLVREGFEVRRGKALCPFHDNTTTPALSLFVVDGRWRYKCHGCGAQGDAIAWVAARERITPIEAARKLAESSGYQVTPSPGQVAVEERSEKVEAWRDPDWQVVVEGLISEAEDQLWSRTGREALAWLRARGLADHTIRLFRLGFLASSRKTRSIDVLRDKQGERGIYAPRGVTLPWVAPGHCYRGTFEGSDDRPRWVGCNVRRLADPDVFATLPHGVEKCMAFRGSSRGFLYPWPDILPTQGELPMLLVEGEFDALIGFQEVGHMLHVATAGSASVRSLPLASRSALALTTWLLLAFDHDQAGVDAVWQWKEKYPHKSRRVLLPAGKDLNEFVSQGGDIQAWIQSLSDEIYPPDQSGATTA